MELKFGGAFGLGSSLLSFNRTFMELKLRISRKFTTSGQMF